MNINHAELSSHCSSSSQAVGPRVQIPVSPSEARQSHGSHTPQETLRPRRSARREAEELEEEQKEQEEQEEEVPQPLRLFLEPAASLSASQIGINQ